MSSPSKTEYARSVVASTTCSRKTTTSAKTVSGRLNVMADEFNAFYEDLDEETTIRKKAEEDRVARLEREIAKLEKVLATETKRRIEASKVLQAMFETKIAKIQEDFKEELRQAFEPLQAQIDTLVERVDTIERTMEQEKRDREKEIKLANKEILDKFSAHQKQFEVEKVTRLQREAHVLKRVGDEVFRIQQKVTAERSSREAAIVLMKDDFMAAHKAREKADEKFKSECQWKVRNVLQKMMRKMAVVEKDLEVETKNREMSEEQLVNALNDYTQALQDGLKIVNRAT